MFYKNRNRIRTIRKIILNRKLLHISIRHSTDIIHMKAEGEVIAQERLEAEAAAEAARKAEEERKAAEAARLEMRRDCGFWR